MVTRSLCTFEVAGQRFGLETARVQEVVRVERLTPVPRAPDDVGGLINLRGLIVLAVNATRRLGLDAAGVPTDAAGPDGPVAVVLASREGPLALLVDEVHEIVEVDESLFEPSGDVLDDEDPAAWLVGGAYRTEGRLTLLLDADRVLASGAGPPPPGDVHRNGDAPTAHVR